MTVVVSGAKGLQQDAELILNQLEDLAKRNFPPNKERKLRAFTIKETADFIGVNLNSLRHTLRTHEETLPQGFLAAGNRRYFEAADIHRIRDHLIETDRLPPQHITRRNRESEAISVICGVNLKGGVAKTSTINALATALAMRGYRILAVDVDAQASLTSMMGITPEFEDDMLTLYDVIRYMDGPDDKAADIRDVVRKTYVPNLDLIPSNMNIIEFEHETAGAPSGGGALPFFQRVSAALAPIQDDYDVILFDAPPQLTFVVLSAIFASNALLIPVTASMIDMMSLGSFLNITGTMMAQIENRIGGLNLDWTKYLITRYQPTDGPQVQLAGFMRSMLGDKVMTAEFLHSTAITDAGTTKQSLLEVDPKSFHPKTYERAMDSISRVVAEVEAEIQKAWGREAGHA
jgi:chromosome partitioning protein